MKKDISISSILLYAVISFFSLPSTASDLEELAQDSWIKLVSPNFEIITNKDDSEALYMIRDLENFRYFIIELMQLQILEGLPPLKILAIHKQSNFEKLNLPESYAGVFYLSLHGYAAIANVENYKENSASYSSGRQVLLHEYVHHLMRFTKLTRKYPKWYDEGNAEYLGSFRLNNNYIYVGDYNSMGYSAVLSSENTGKQKFNSEWLMNVTSINMNSTRNKDQIEATAFYEQSFFLVNYINTSDELKKSLQNYLYDIYMGYPQDTSFKRSFKMTYKELDKQVIRYMRSGAKMAVYSAKNRDGSNKFIATKYKNIPLTKADFLYEIAGIITKYGNFSREEKLDVLNKAIQANPTRYEIQAEALTLGLIKNPDQTLNILEEHIPDDSMLLTHKGNQKQHYAEMLRLVGAPNWEITMKDARSYYRRAIKADGFNALAYMGLANIYLYLPETEPLREGILGFTQASIYDRDKNTFLDAANLALRIGDTSKALMMLRNGIAFGNQITKESYGYILDNLEILFELTGNAPTKNGESLVYEEGSYYKGSIKNGRPHGFGKIVRENGSYYEGEFVNGIMQGKGRLWSIYGNTSYEGDFHNGIMYGKATLKFSEILPYTDYTGDIAYGQAHGQGTYISDRGTYTGQFWRGIKHGQGTFITSENNRQLNGKWIYGNYEWPELNGEIYVGEVSRKGKRMGKGLCRPTNSYTTIISCEYHQDTKVRK